MDDMKDTLAIKILSTELPAKALMELKKLTGLSLAEIKAKAANDDYLLVCEYVDTDGLKLMNKIKRAMKKYQVSVRQFEDGKERSSELFDNIEKLHAQIDAEDYPD